MLFNKTQPDKNGQSHLSVTWRTLRDQYNRWANWQSVKLSNRLMENLESKTTSTDYQYIILSPEHDLTYEDLEEFSGTDYLYLLMLLGKVPKQSVDRYERETNQSFYLWAEDEGDDQSQGGGGGSVAASAHRSSQPSSSRRSLKKIELKKGPGKDGTAATPAPSAPPAPAPGPPFPGTGPSAYSLLHSRQAWSRRAPPWVNPNMMSGPGSGGMPPSIMPCLHPTDAICAVRGGGLQGVSYGDGSVESAMSDEQRLVHLQQQQFHQQQQQQRSMEAMQHIDQLSELASTQAVQAADLRKGVCRRGGDQQRHRCRERGSLPIMASTTTRRRSSRTPILFDSSATSCGRGGHPCPGWTGVWFDDVKPNTGDSCGPGAVDDPS